MQAENDAVGDAQARYETGGGGLAEKPTIDDDQR